MFGAVKREYEKIQEMRRFNTAAFQDRMEYTVTKKRYFQFSRSFGKLALWNVRLCE
jgi:hypothetical protein